MIGRGSLKLARLNICIKKESFIKFLKEVDPIFTQPS